MNELVCDRCKDIAFEDELSDFLESYEFWGHQITETRKDYSCRCCRRGTYVEASLCELCGEYYPKEYYGDFCPECEKKKEEFDEEMLCIRDLLTAIASGNACDEAL